MADQYYMCSAARVNRFEMKDTCIESVINVWPQGTNVWSKTEFNNKFAEIAVLIFCEINESTPGFCLVFSEAYS